VDGRFASDNWLRTELNVVFDFAFDFDFSKAFDEVLLVDLLHKSPGLAFFHEDELDDSRQMDRALRFLRGAWHIVIVMPVFLEHELMGQVKTITTNCNGLFELNQKIFSLFPHIWESRIEQKYCICCTLFGVKHWPAVEYPVYHTEGILPEILYQLRHVQELRSETGK